MNPHQLPDQPLPEAWWPHGPTEHTPHRPGVETRQVLLTLGAICLVVAFTAGTALVWSALGPGGQAALMGAVTLVLLIGAASLPRLPATAEALAAVGLTGCVVDAVAARTLHLSFAVDLPLHSYIAFAAVGVTAVAATLGMAARRLASPPLVWSTAPLVAAVAAVNPSTIDRSALLAPVGIAAMVGIDTALRRLYPPDAPARTLAAIGGALVTLIGFMTSLLAAVHHDPAAWFGAALPAGLFALPALFPATIWATDEAAAWLSGMAAAGMLIAGGLHTSTDTRAVAAIALLLVAAYAQLPNGSGWGRRTQLAIGTLAFPGGIAFASLIGVNQQFAIVDLTLAGAAAGIAIAWPRSRAESHQVRIAAMAASTILASVGAGITLYLHGVTTPEAYVATPAGLSLTWGAALLFRNRSMPSLVLLPGLLIGLLPTLALALGVDHGRQALLLVAAALLVIVGAELRLGTPLVTGTAIIGLLSVRLIGPQLATMPKWVLFGAVGAVLLTLGATWEARLEDIRRLSAQLRPRIAALR